MKNYKTLVTTLVLASIAIAPMASLAQTSKVKSSNDMTHSQMMMTMSSMFKGVEVNGGTVSYSHGKSGGMLTLSPDFVLPKTPAPHWQVVDKQGNVYLLNQLKIAGDKLNKTVMLPKYIHSVAKVQIWCSFAEVVLGEAKFGKVIEVR